MIKRTIKPEIFAKLPKSNEYLRTQARIRTVRIALLVLSLLLIGFGILSVV